MNLQSIISVLTEHTKTRDGQSTNWLGQLSVDELKKIDNTVHNMREATLSGLRITGDLISAYEESRGGFDNNAAGWLVMHLTGDLEGTLELEYLVKDEFVRRGFDLQGYEIKGVRRG